MSEGYKTINIGHMFEDRDKEKEAELYFLLNTLLSYFIFSILY